MLSRSRVAYKFVCTGCNACYIDKTFCIFRHLFVSTFVQIKILIFLNTLESQGHAVMHALAFFKSTGQTYQPEALLLIFMLITVPQQI